MPNYLFGYQLNFKNAEDETVFIEIYDTTTEDSFGGAVLYDIEGSDTPLIISTVNNERRKDNPIRPLQAQIQFISTTAISLNHFIGGNDGKWYVEIRKNSTYIFKGYVLQDDILEEFIASDNRNVVTLIATDNLGMLKDVPLTDPSGLTPRKESSLIKYIAWALQKTGLQLNINVINNVRQYEEQALNMLTSTYLNAKSFEAEIGVSEDCYTVLQKIMGASCFITQFKGEWWISRTDEFEVLRETHKRFIFDYKGNYVSDSNIGLRQSFVQGSALQLVRGSYVSAQGAKKEAKLTYAYEYPKEIIDNIDFDRGAELSGGTPTEKTYYLDDWQVLKSTNTAQYWNSATQPTSGARVVRKFDALNYEKERYVQGDGQGVNEFHYLRSNPIPLGANDRFVFSVDIRLEKNIPNGTNYNTQLHAVLFGDDGKEYFFFTAGTDITVGDDDHEWRTTTMDVMTNTNITVYPGAITLPNESTAPVAGMLVLFIPFAQNGQQGVYAVNFTNVQFEYNAFINGSYQKYKAQFHKVTQSDINKYRTPYDEPVNVSDSPRRLFKGALLTDNAWVAAYTGGASFGLNNVLGLTGFFYDFEAGDIIRVTNSTSNNGIFKVTKVVHPSGGTQMTLLEGFTQELDVSITVERLTFKLVNQFYSAVAHPLGPPSLEAVHPYGHLEAFEAWNQHNRVFRVIEFSAKGLTTLPGTMNDYVIDQAGAHTSNKLFTLLSMEQDIRRCTWRGLLAEIHDSTIEKDYDSTKVFKYQSER